MDKDMEMVHVSMSMLYWHIHPPERLGETTDEMSNRIYMHV